MGCDLAAAPPQPSHRPWAYSGPVDLLARPGEDLLSPLWQCRLVWAFLAIGILARCLRYALRFPPWEDECFLAVNFIDRGFLDLLKPLDCHQTAPVLFLWTELAITRLLGFTELTLRLVPLLASLAGLVLFWHIARRLLTGPALVVAVAFMAVAYPGIRYAAEAKQYATDFFMAAALIALAVEWWRQPHRTPWLWALAILAPVAVAMSYPCIFVAGGVGLFVALLVGAQRQWRCLWPLAAFAAAAAGVFVLLYLVAVGEQGAAEMTYMRGAWRRAFPPSPAEPLKLAQWLIVTHTGPLLAVPAGSDNGGSSLTFILCLAGLWALLRRRAWPMVVLAMAPPAFQLIAAALRRYPYGDHVKFSQPFLTMICVLAGLGTLQLLSPLARQPIARRVLIGALGLLALMGAGTMARDVASPYKTQSDLRARAFAQWFWFSGSARGQVLCADRDLGLNLTPDVSHELSWWAMYYCNERLYRPSGARREQPDPNRISEDSPLRVAVYRADLRAFRKLHFDDQALQTWLESMNEQYRLVSRESFPMFRKDRRDRKVIAEDYVDVYRFIPRTGDGDGRARP